MLWITCFLLVIHTHGTFCNGIQPSTISSPGTFLTEVSSVLGWCKSKTASDIWNSGYVIRACDQRVPFKDGIGGLQFSADFNFVPLLCTALYDATNALCLEVRSVQDTVLMLNVTIPTAVTFCNDLKNMISRNSTSYLKETKIWMEVFSKSMQNETKCRSVCIANGRTNPICEDIFILNMLLLQYNKATQKGLTSQVSPSALKTLRGGKVDTVPETSNHTQLKVAEEMRSGINAGLHQQNDGTHPREALLQSAPSTAQKNEQVGPLNNITVEDKNVMNQGPSLSKAVEKPTDPETGKKSQSLDNTKGLTKNSAERLPIDAASQDSIAVSKSENPQSKDNTEVTDRANDKHVSNPPVETAAAQHHSLASPETVKPTNNAKVDKGKPDLSNTVKQGSPLEPTNNKVLVPHSKPEGEQEHKTSFDKAQETEKPHESQLSEETLNPATSNTGPQNEAPSGPADDIPVDGTDVHVDEDDDGDGDTFLDGDIKSGPSSVEEPPRSKAEAEGPFPVEDLSGLKAGHESNMQIQGTVEEAEFVKAENPHFFTYFMTMIVLCIIGYLVFHNKQKILALALEGRSRRGARRRPNTSGYRKLDSNLEEAVTSTCSSTSVSHVIY